MDFFLLRNCSIITVGDELIDGYRLDSNSKWLASQLNIYNIKVDSIISIGDNCSKIICTLNAESQKKLDYIFITGGLGSTEDDKTVESVKVFLDSSYFFDKDYMDELNMRTEKKGELGAMIQNQSQRIKGVDYMDNPIGTAVPFSFSKLDTKFFVFPGVPAELKAICRNSVFPEICNQNPVPCRSIHIIGIGESSFSYRIGGLISKYSSEIKFSFLPNHSGLTLRLTSLKKDVKLLETVKKKIIAKAGKYYFSDKDISLASFVLEKLKDKKMTLGAAESCTGGSISRLITDCPGSSDVFKGGIISYSNEIKENCLNIQDKTINRYGAVSKQVSEQMCIESANMLNVDVAIACTGISGPSGGSEDKPVGTVFISILYMNSVYTKKFKFLPDRKIHREMTAVMSLNMLRLLLSEKWN